MMQNVHVDYSGTDLTFDLASNLAVNAARDNRIQDPEIISWHHRGSNAMSPNFDGADPGTWWEKYGAGNGGGLEISVGDEYDFVVMDTRGYETIDELPLRNLFDSHGEEFVCLSPILGDASTPNERACVPLDEWTADQY